MNLIWVVGPPAVGKMAVARKISEKTGYKYLLNHGTIELLIPIFPWGDPKFRKLDSEFRLRIFEEVATSQLKGFLFTYVPAYNLKEEREYMEKLTNVFKALNHNVFYVELHAPLSIRLERNKHPERLDAKPSKRNIKWSEENVISTDQKYPHLVSSEKFPFFFPENYIKIDNSNFTAEAAAEKVIREFNLVKNL